MIEEIFKNKNLKLTNQRKLIYEIIEKEDFPTIKVIQSTCKNNLNITTIYRILDIFLKKKLITKKVNIKGEIYYEIKPLDHSHYINCIKCHKRTKIDSEAIEEFEHKVLKDYKLIDHDIEFVGICNDCIEN